MDGPKNRLNTIPKISAININIIIYQRIDTLIGGTSRRGESIDMIDGHIGT